MTWRRFFRRSRWDQERARELETYLEIETDENIARGMSPEEARCAAHRKLGNTTLIREEIYRMNSIGFLEILWHDLRFGLRMLAKSSSFTIVSVLTLALGIGANTAIFSVVDATLIQPLPYSNASRLVMVWETRLPDRNKQNATSPATFLNWRDDNSVSSRWRPSATIRRFLRVVILRSNSQYSRLLRTCFPCWVWELRWAVLLRLRRRKRRHRKESQS